jgi:exopolysaccharide biosynthesis polyprenyl glycosylphosphotransferase
MLRRFSISFAVFSMALDFLLVGLSLLAMTVLRPLMSSLPFIAAIPSTTWMPPIFYFLFPLLWVIIYAAASLYDGKKYMRVSNELAGLTISSLVASICLAGILYLTSRETSRAFFLSFAALSFLLCLVWRLAARAFFRLNKQNLNLSQRVLIIGESISGRKLLKHFEKNMPAMFQSIKFAYPYDKEKDAYTRLQIFTIRQALIDEQITDLVISIPAVAIHKIDDLLTALDDLPVNIWVGLDFLDLSFAETRVEDFFGIPMLDLRALALSEFDQLIKRMFDIGFTLLSMVVILPLTMITALLVAIFDGFPIFFHQERVGQNGKIFKVHKFRTMVKNAENLTNETDVNGDALPHKMRDDPRVTRLGRVLRRLSLDELPQFFNVLAGEMSVVGPRPELPHLVEQYERWQRKRLTVLPGISGWWQVTGRSEKMLHLNTQDDIYYVQNYSIWLDLQIIIRTLWVVIVGKGAF